jgi:hypothetical protein
MRHIHPIRALAFVAAIVCGLSLPGRAAAATTNETMVPAKESFHIYLLMGQSNMVGRDTRGLPTNQNNPRILMLDTNGQWVVAKDPLHPKIGHIDSGIGPGMSFAEEMLKADSNVTIGLVPCAVGGTPLRRWVKGGDLYENAVSLAKVAAKSGVLKGVLWHQGESDTDKKENAESYKARLTQMFRDLRSDLNVPDLPIVVGQLGLFLEPEKFPYLDTVRAAIKQMPGALPQVGYADSVGLGDKGDRLHFSAEAQREFGRRYASALQQLQNAKGGKNVHE